MQELLNDLLERYPQLQSCAESIIQAYYVIRDSYSAGGKLLLCGNGGSSADTEHWSSELLKGFVKRRELSDEQKKGLSADLADSLQQALPAIPLGSFTALNTAFLNDVNGEFGFAQLVQALGRREDVLVGISTSGKAKNVCFAFEVAAARGIKTIALTGAKDSRLSSLASISVQVPEIETYKVQELHLPIYHSICLMLEDYFFEE